VSKDITLENIGKLLGEGFQKDAIHIAVVPVIAGQDMLPGQPVKISHIGGKAMAWEIYDEEKYEGVVDPFLREPVKDGERFFLFLVPGTITGLRHDWTHPAFPSSATSTDRSESERWLRDYAERYCADYDEMLEGAVSGLGFCFGDDDGPPQYRNAEDEFWRHVEAVTGKRFSEKHRENTPFRCAC
jgi:hypothetical protein